MSADKMAQALRDLRDCVVAHNRAGANWGEHFSSVMAALQDAGAAIAEHDAKPPAQPADAAPDLLAALKEAYALLADIHHEWRGRNTQEGQRLLVDMRDAINAAEGRQVP